MSMSEPNEGRHLRDAVAPLSLHCEACGDDTLILPGCVTTRWVCHHCGAALRQDAPVGPRQRHAVIADPVRKSVSFDQLEDELARLAMESATHHRRDDPRLPRLYDWSGLVARVPGNPRIPKLVRLYGAVFAVLGTIGFLRSVYSSVGACATSLLESPGAHIPLTALYNPAVAALLVAIGAGLGRGRRTAVYGAALMTGGFAILTPFGHASHWLALATAPLFVSAVRHWRRFS